MSYYLVHNGGGAVQLQEARTAAEKRWLLGYYKAKGREVQPVDWSTARQWVRAGGQHNTALYVDIDGRVRRAQEERDR